MVSIFLQLSNRLTGYLIAVAGIGAVTFVLSLFRQQINATAIALAFLLVVLITATFFGSRPAFLASFLGVLSFNFFFLPPLYTLTISDSQNWVAFGAFLVTALVAGQLSSYARRRAEEAEKGRQELERLYGELQNVFEKASQTEALRRSEKLKSALLDAVTHDLRTPLTSIKASVTTLLEDAKNVDGETENSINLDAESRAEFLEIINEETDRLNEFIGSMVELARVEAGQMKLRKSWSDAEDVVKTAVKRAGGLLKNHQISVETQGELPSVFIDKNSVSEVIYNLLDNAAKYSPEGSQIKIKCARAAEDSVEIAVIDQGKGIPEDMREKVFDKFERAEISDIHTTSSGLGLGLAIAKGVIESQNGRIWIEDAAAGFTTKVVIRIPINDDEEQI